MFFQDRTDAGEKLAPLVLADKTLAGTDVIGLARGGVIVAAPIATALGSRLQSMGVEDFSIDAERVLAVTSLGTATLFAEHESTFVSNLSPFIELEGFPDFLAEQTMARHRRFNGERPLEVGRSIVLCDDGIVTGRSVIAAINSLRHAGAVEVVVAVPVIPSYFPLVGEGFRVIPWRISAMKKPKTGAFYSDFEDTADEEVIEAIRASTPAMARAS